MGQAVDLACALVQYRSETLGIRALVIKGAPLAIQGLRPFRVSSDVDVLVEPGRSDELLRALEQVGWLDRAMNADELTFPRHSHSLINTSWPCDIDLHFRYPGMESGDAFEALWERRQKFRVAGVDVWTPDRIGNALVMALHGLRAPWIERHSAELALLAERLTDEDFTEILKLAARTHSQRALLPLLQSAEQSFRVLPTWPPMSDEWVIRTTISSNVARRWHYWSSLPIRRRIPLIWEAVFPPVEEFRVQNLYGPFDRKTMLVLYARRAWKGVKQLPTAVQQLRRSH